MRDRVIDSEYADVLGMRIAVRDDRRDLPPVVCLHAVGHDRHDFDRFAATMRGRFRIIAPDWPGHGESSADRERPSVRRYAQVLEGLLDAIGVERATLVGNSIGGGAALRFTAEFPGRVRALVLENPAGLDPVDVVSRPAIAAMVRFFEAGAAGAPWFPAAFAAYYLAVLPSRPAREQRARIVSRAREMAPLLVQAWSSFSDPEESLVDVTATVSRPTLVAWAMRDRFVQLWRSRPAIARFANATLREFDAGHSPHLETPAEFEDAFLHFMSETERDETS